MLQISKALKYGNVKQVEPELCIYGCFHILKFAHFMRKILWSFIISKKDYQNTIRNLEKLVLALLEAK